MPSLAIIGASHASIAFLESLKPRLPPNLQVTVIDASTEFQWHPSHVRLITDPSFVGKAFSSLLGQMGKYPFVSFLNARVLSVDPAQKVLSLSSGDTVSYDVLLIASGSSTLSPEWKSVPSSSSATSASETNKSLLSALAGAVKGARTVVVGGAGPIGIESSAEIKYAFPDKRVVLICSEDVLMAPPQWAASLGPKALSQLKALGVEVIFGTRVTGPAQTSTTPVAVQLSKGEAIQADVYISAVGTKSNADFMPEEFKDEKGWIKTSSTLQSQLDPCIFVIGDAANFARKFAAVTGDQGKIAAGNVVKFLANPSAKLSEYTNNGTILGIVTVGPKGGVGQFSWLKFPSFMVAMIKGKDLMLSMAPKPVAV